MKPISLLGVLITLNWLAANCFADEAPQMEILEARYGAEGHWKNVKPHLDSLKHQLFALADVRSRVMGGDPAPDMEKELVVRVRLGKTESEQRFKERSWALIVAPSDPEFLKQFQDESKEKLVIVEAKKVYGGRSQDWL